MHENSKLGALTKMMIKCSPPFHRLKRGADSVAAFTVGSHDVCGFAAFVVVEVFLMYVQNYEGYHENRKSTQYFFSLALDGVEKNSRREQTFCQNRSNFQLNYWFVGYFIAYLRLS